MQGQEQPDLLALRTGDDPLITKTAFFSRPGTAFCCASGPQNESVIHAELCKSTQLETAGESAASRQTDDI